MKAQQRSTATGVRTARLLMAATCMTASLASAQQTPAPAASMPSMDMPGMMTSDSAPASDTTSDHSSAAEQRQSSTAPIASSHAMPAMDHAGPATADSPGGNGPMHMGSMQGGSAPPDARSGDYSDGVGYGAMKGMDMQDNMPVATLLVDQLETVHGGDASNQAWEAEGWVGNDIDKVWLRTEGERHAGRVEDGDIEALWNHAIAAYWSSQLGVRQDMGQGPDRHWAAFGLQGLSPYWFELEATGYFGDAGRTAARFRAQYEVLFTQRLVLQPELEINLYGQSDPARRVRSGLSDAQLGLRLRYEITRQFAPYVGLLWTRHFAHAAGSPMATSAGESDGSSFERQWTIGVRFWF